MNAADLVRAIKLVDPDGEGIARVLGDARNRKLIKGNMFHCVLGSANNRNAEWQTTAVWETYNQEDQRLMQSVMEWFDSLDHPCDTVRLMLEYK